MVQDADIERRRHERALRIIRHWRLLDDVFMKRCLKDNIPAVECILRIIMERPSLRVLDLRVEDVVPNLLGRGIRMDIHAVDAEGRHYNIEIQREDHGAGRKRARFNSSLLDLNSLRQGESYQELPETYVIFITENDVLRHGLARYHVYRVVEELEEPFGDGANIIYVNGAYQGDDDMGRLMHDFRSESPETMTLEPLKEVVDRYKNHPEEVAAMCKELEAWSEDERREGREEGREEGKHEGAVSMLRSLIEDGTISIAAAAKKLGVTETAFRKMAML